jgi:hypothetical protein
LDHSLIDIHALCSISATAAGIASRRWRPGAAPGPQVPGKSTTSIRPAVQQVHRNVVRTVTATQQSLEQHMYVHHGSGRTSE